MEERTVVILGATGSIGRQTLDVIEHEKSFKLVGISFHRNVDFAKEVVEKFGVTNVVVTSGVSVDLPGIRIWRGVEGLRRMLEELKPDITVIAISGFDALEAVLIAIENSKRVCLANKESLVCGGFLVKEKLAKHNTELIPVDSEHNALFQLMEEDVEKVILTASGGALRDWDLTELPKAKPEDVLRHPVWNMGNRITVDSATMVNKAFEVLEAMELFDLPFEKIEVKIHREGLVHGMLVLPDGSVKILLSKADMRIPISYALSYPNRMRLKNAVVELSGRSLVLSFEDPDPKRYPAFFLVGHIKHSYRDRIAYNAADEVAVEAFLKGKISFGGIYVIIEKTLERMISFPEPRSLEEVKVLHELSKREAERVEEWLSSTSC